MRADGGEMTATFQPICESRCLVNLRQVTEMPVHANQWLPLSNEGIEWLNILEGSSYVKMHVCIRATRCGEWYHWCYSQKSFYTCLVMTGLLLVLAGHKNLCHEGVEKERGVWHVRAGKGGRPKAGKKILRKITDALPVFWVYVCRFQQHPVGVGVGYQRYSQSTCSVHAKNPPSHHDNFLWFFCEKIHQGSQSAQIM